MRLQVLSKRNIENIFSHPAIRIVHVTYEAVLLLRIGKHLYRTVKKKKQREYAHGDVYIFQNDPRAALTLNENVPHSTKIILALNGSAHNNETQFRIPTEQSPHNTLPMHLRNFVC